MICPNCKKETPRLAFCGNCGAALPEQQPTNPYTNDAALAPRTKNNAWAGIVALICGGLSVLACVSVVGGFFLGIAAIVFGILGVKSENRGLAIGGIICGAAGILFSLLMIVLALGFTTRIVHEIVGMPEMQEFHRFYF